MTLPIPTPEERAHLIRVSLIGAAISVLLAVVFGVAGIFGIPNTWVGSTICFIWAALQIGNAIVVRRQQRREQQVGPL
jgi:hypothetical protein